MPKIIKDGAVVEDNWQLLQDTEQALPDEPVIVPLALWEQRRDELLDRGDIGVWLASDQSPKSLAPDLSQLALVAIDFPQFADGRGFSYARELREQGFKGEIRAIGYFMRDQLFYMSRCGINSFALQTADLESALDSLKDFSETYQAAQDQPLPLFRRR